MVCSWVDMSVAFPEIADAVFADAFGRVFAIKVVSVRGIDVIAEAGQGKKFFGFSGRVVHSLTLSILELRLGCLPSLVAHSLVLDDYPCEKYGYSRAG